MLRIFLVLWLALTPAFSWAGSMTLLGVGTPPVAAGGGCAQATAFLARTSGLNGTHTTAYTNLICGMVTDGLITGSMSGPGSGSSACGSKFDGLYIEATQTSTVALLNLCSTSYSLSVVTSPTFTTDRGYQANSTADQLGTGFNPSTATSPNLTLNSAHMSVWINTNSSDTLAIMGGGSGSSILNLYPKFSDGNLYSRINDGSSSSGYAISNPMGLLIGNRSGASAIQAYQNGTSLGSGTQASGTGVVGNTIQVLGDNGAVSTTAFQVSAISFGASLSSTDASNFYSRTRTYMTAVGVP